MPRSRSRRKASMVSLLFLNYPDKMNYHVLRSEDFLQRCGRGNIPPDYFSALRREGSRGLIRTDQAPHFVTLCDQVFHEVPSYKTCCTGDEYHVTPFRKQ